VHQVTAIIIRCVISLMLLYSLLTVTNATSSIDKQAVKNSATINSHEKIVKSDTTLAGVNMLGYFTTTAEARENGRLPPMNYYEDSFRIFSQAGMNNVRYLFTWESYHKNPSLFMNELFKVARIADKWKINVIYANDQFHISSWLDQHSGYGFPSFLFMNKPQFPAGGGGASDNITAQVWWTEWYNRSIKNENGTADGWSLQSDFLKKIIRAVDNHSSTLGYEILNEPQVYVEDQWEKIGNYNTFIANELRHFSNKTLVFDRQLPSDVGAGPINAVPENMAKMVPRNVRNIVFKTTLYGLPTHCSYAEARLNTAATTAQLLGIPMWVGEFNIGITGEDPQADINQTEVNLFVKKFDEIRAWGWSFWVWGFGHHPQNVRNYDLANTTQNDGERRIEPTRYFDYAKNAIATTETENTGGVSSTTSNRNASVLTNEGLSDQLDVSPLGNHTQITNVSDTICPTIPVTKLDGALRSSDYSLSTSSLKPVLIAKTLPGQLLVQGDAYDIGSGVKTVEIKLINQQIESSNNNQPYHQLISNSEKSRHWFNWTAYLPISAAGFYKLIVKAADHAGNVNYNTIFIKAINENSGPSTERQKE
jgi:hypothetical protein